MSGGLSPDGFAALQRRRRTADMLMNQATGATEMPGSGSVFGAMARGISGLAGGLESRRIGQEAARYAQASPLAAASLQGDQDNRIPIFGSLFGNGMFAQPPASLFDTAQTKGDRAGLRQVKQAFDQHIE